MGQYGWHSHPEQTDNRKAELKSWAKGIDVLGTFPRFIYFLTFYLKISLDLQKICKNSTEGTHMPHHTAFPNVKNLYKHAIIIKTNKATLVQFYWLSDRCVLFPFMIRFYYFKNFVKMLAEIPLEFDHQFYSFSQVYNYCAYHVLEVFL